jgi:hypothetical protein
MRTIQSTYTALLGLIAITLMAIVAYGNGGPFVVKYPNGDPSAKGVFAKMDYTLHPAREARLRVVKEDLRFNLLAQKKRPLSDVAPSDSIPLVTVIASYAIENPTQKEIAVDFGFPILRGIYILPTGMGSRPDVEITVDGTRLTPDIITNSKIYGIIRQGARDSIEAGIKTDSKLAQLIAAVRKASGIAPSGTIETSQLLSRDYPLSEPDLFNRQTDLVSEIKEFLVSEMQSPPPAIIMPAPTEDYEPAREKLRKYLIEKKRWNDREAALLVEYASLDWGRARSRTVDNWALIPTTLMSANLGPLSAIGEQKATQFFAQIASHFDKTTAETYESIFSAWGGDVRDRSVDLDSGNVRLREIEIKDPQDIKIRQLANTDTTIYARVDYLDPNANINPTEKAACRNILKNLPVVFTFAPMNLLHYQVAFQPQQTRNVTVTYTQYAYLDTRGIPSYQLAYVLHPASLWNDFGPINIQIQTPEGVACRASVPLGPGSAIASDKAIARTPMTSIEEKYYYGGIENPTYPLIQYEARLDKSKEKTGELFLAVSKTEWEAFIKTKK